MPIVTSNLNLTGKLYDVYSNLTGVLYNVYYNPIRRSSSVSYGTYIVTSNLTAGDTSLVTPYFSPWWVSYVISVAIILNLIDPVNHHCLYILPYPEI